VYSVSLHLATLPMSKMMGVINQVAFPAVARLQDDPERLKRRLLQACGLLMVVTVPVLWGLSAVASELVALVLGPNWSAAVRPLQLVALVVPLRVIHGIFNTAVVGVGRAGTALRNTIATAIVWPTCFLVGALWGADGLAASWLVAIPTTFLLNFPRTSASVGVAFGDVLRTLMRPAVAGVTMVASIAGTRLLIADWALMLRSAVLIVVGAGVYLVTITLLDRSVWSQLRHVMSSRSGAI
jgi:O-antigen/teichoic acid export membrane protein